MLATSSTNFSHRIAGMSSENEQYPPIEATMRKALTTELKPVFMEVINESPMHNTPKQAESHFRVFVVSDKFNDLTLIKVKCPKESFVIHNINWISDLCAAPSTCE